MNLLPWRRKTEDVERYGDLPFQQWVDMLGGKTGVFYPQFSQTLQGDRESIVGDYPGLITGAYKSNPIVRACIDMRMFHFAQARFQFQNIRSSYGRPGRLFGGSELAILESPQPNWTTADLLARMLLHADLAGNAYVIRWSNRLQLLQPNWMSIVLGSQTDRRDWEPGDPDTEVIGYAYQPGGPKSGRPEMLFQTDEIAHFAPEPDPAAMYRGTSWLATLIREIQADASMSQHRQMFFEAGATVNLLIKPDETVRTKEHFDEFVRAVRAGHQGVGRAYEMLFLANGADAVPIGADMQQVDFRAIQGAGETRIAVAARTPPTLLHISEGQQGSTLNAGNYQSARRQFADEFLRYYWGQAASSLAVLVRVPSDSRLWVDDRDIAFLQEDVKDAAEARQTDAATLSSLVSNGWDPLSSQKAIIANDWSLLRHTGLIPVQLQAPPAMYPGSNGATNGTMPALMNGNGSGNGGTQTLTPKAIGA